jgi:N-acetyl-gamma-glutamyl-phosphate reductase
MIKAGIIGGSGYTGGELIRLLLQHPHASLDFVFSTTRGGQAVSKTHPDLLGITEMAFTDRINPETDVVFLCLGHGNSRKFLQEHDFAGKCRIIDLSNDFRLKEDAGVGDRRFTYGLPELFRKEIQQAENIANPGCYATAIQLALLPLAAGNKLGSAVHVNAVTGSTGAGTANNDTSHFSWRNNNVSWYKPFTHQHLDEIMQSLHFLQPNTGHLYFLPNRGNFTRGILATAYTAFDGSREDAEALYRDFYNEAPFTQVSADPLALKQVVNSNQCHIHLHKHEDILLVTSVLDNLLKGASGQAIQNMNLMFGFNETAGLLLKAGVY